MLIKKLMNDITVVTSQLHFSMFFPIQNRPLFSSSKGLLHPIQLFLSPETPLHLTISVHTFCTPERKNDSINADEDQKSNANLFYQDPINLQLYT
jgi:hypothetical protein